MLRHLRPTVVAVALGTIALGTPGWAQPLSPQAAAQINALMAEKLTRSSAQRKMSAQLVYAVKQRRGDAIAAAVPALRVYLPDATARGVVVDVRADVSDALLAQLKTLGAEVLDVNASYRHVRLRVQIDRLEWIAALPAVSYVQPKQEAMTSRLTGHEPTQSVPTRLAALRLEKQNERHDVLTRVGQALTAHDDRQASVGSQNSQGDTTHRAAAARATYGVSGAGVKIGVLSDGVTNLAASQALGDLGPVTVLPAQAGSGDEGTAMLEIVHDLAPNAELYFATALGSTASFAQNIRNLQAAGCNIIIDDVYYFVESPLQDGQTGTSQTNGGIIAQAVKDVAAAGVLYFASAGNSGNKNDNTSGTWEGDYVDGGAAGGPLVGAGQLHNFGGVTYNTLLASIDNPISLFWADPLGGSANDYDLYLLDSTGTAVVGVSNEFQTGTQDPFEIMSGGFSGDRVVVVKFAGSARFLRLGTNRNRLSISTAGEISGHAATSAPNSFGVAAVSAFAVFPNAFSAGNSVETFSSDGPRRIFFTESGAAITPGNFTASGGAVLQKPDLTAADGASVTGVGGFPSPFYGTSAAAPHAGAIAALVKSRSLSLTATQVRTALFGSAIDIEAAGVDRDSGIGIIMADRAVAGVVRGQPPGDFDGDGRSDVAVFRPSTGVWWIRSALGGVTGLGWGGAGDVPVPGDYDGDGRVDIAVFRPSTGVWYLRNSSTSTLTSIAWGDSADVAVPADYGGDGLTDVAVFRPSTGVWYIRDSGAPGLLSIAWGGGSDVPVAGDYDGDRRADVAVFRPSTGVWYIRNSSTSTLTSVGWGGAADVAAPGDYDGDGQTDIAVFRPSTGVWYLRNSSTSTLTSVGWGGAADVPVPGDYDGDSQTDIAVFRPSTGVWYIRDSSTGGVTTIGWGNSLDIPINKRP